MFTASFQVIILKYEFENYNFKITATSPKGEWRNIFTKKLNGINEFLCSHTITFIKLSICYGQVFVE